MTTAAYTLQFSGGESRRLPQGIFFYIMDASAPIDIETEGVTVAPLRITAAPAGAKYGPVTPDKKWRNLLVTSATAQTVKIVISDDAEFKAADAVTVVGDVNNAERPSAAFTTPAAVPVANGASGTIAANTSRKRLSICNPSTNGGSFWLMDANNASPRGIELQAGTTIELKNTAAIFVRNDSGGPQSYTYLEET